MVVDRDTVIAYVPWLHAGRPFVNRAVLTRQYNLHLDILQHDRSHDVGVRRERTMMELRRTQ